MQLIWRLNYSIQHPFIFVQQAIAMNYDISGSNNYFYYHYCIIIVSIKIILHLKIKI